MANQNLAEQLKKLKQQLAIWQQELTNYKQWAIANDGVISKTEQYEIDRRASEVDKINARIFQIEKAKGINQEAAPTEVQQSGKNTVNTSGKISGTVGQGGANIAADVTLVQTLLNKFGYRLTTDGDCGKKSIAAIMDFQSKKAGFSKPDGLISPDGKTWKILSGSGAAEQPQTTPTTTTEQPVSKLSGSVGEGGKNVAADVMLVKKLLNKVIAAGLTETDVNVGPKTVAAIKKFQTDKLGAAKVSGLIEVDSESWKVLNGGTAAPVTEQPAATVTPNAVLSAQVGLGKANKPGDVAAIQQLLNTHGYKFAVDGVFNNALSDAIKKFQKEKVGSSSPDGVVDPGGKTWKTLKGETVPSENTTPAGPLNKPNWISIAEGEIGQKEKAGSEHNPKIVEYHSTTGKSKDDETAWCSSFVNWVMNKAGQGGTNSAMAVSWAKWGKKVTKPAYGCIAVIDWDGPGPGWKGHVGFVVGMKGSSILLLGGNQSNAVNISSFGTSKVIAYIYPSNFEIPENFYTFGEASGDFGDDTDIGNTR